MPPTLPQNYDHTEAEARWQGVWEEKKVYAWDATQPRANTFVIDTPPPTVSGHLHMGHVFSYTQADFIARYQRMRGKTVFYPMGFDDNGLPTERLVEKTRGKKAAQYESREAFIADCLEVSAEARTAFRALFTSTALSVDWAQEYHTISESSRRLSQLSFLDLHRKGKAYRQLQPMLWDPVDQTAIAQAEVVDKELASHFTDIVFTVIDALTDKASPLEGGRLEGGGAAYSDTGTSRSTPTPPSPLKGEGESPLSPALSLQGEGKELIIGTTRPELLPACVAVFVHPEDARYTHLIGRRAITPLFGISVPILADEKVQIDKGTGAVMCCTFGDETDIHWWKTHNLPTRVVLNQYGKIHFLDFGVRDSEQMTTQSNYLHFYAEGLEYEAGVLNSSMNKGNTRDIHSAIEILNGIKGLKAEAARAKVLELLMEAGLIRQQVAITHAVKTAERSGATLELLPTHQWFVRVLEAKEELKARSRACNWHPEWMSHRMEQWIDGLSWDWCISRQRYFGVPFPVWYSKRAGEEGKILLADADQLPVNPLVDLPKGYTREEVEADRDVMDTWATSSISPQLNSHAVCDTLPGDITRYKQLFPADLRPQAHEIIRTWAFYTLVKSHYHADAAPWKNLMISGWCLAEDKSKMSKSKGNIVTPVDLITESSADAVRYWTSTARLGADTAFSKDLLKIGRKLVTKLWNATKFAAIQLESLEAKPGKSANDDAGRIGAALDRWVLTRLSRALAKATEAFEDFEYAGARAAMEDFFWNDFCDQYLEMVKARAYDAEGQNPAGKLSAQLTIHHCLDGILRGFAPFLPHVTEELWSHLFPEAYALAGSIHARGTWPNAADYPQDLAAERSGIAAVEVLNAIRKAKSERAVSIKWPVDRVRITGAGEGDSRPDWALLAPVEADIRAAGNVAEMEWTETLPNAQPIEDKRFLLEVTLAEAKDVA